MKKNSVKNKEKRRDGVKATPAAVAAALMGLGVFAISVVGLSNGKGGSLYLMALSLLFFAAVGLAAIRR